MLQFIHNFEEVEDEYYALPWFFESRDLIICYLFPYAKIVSLHWVLAYVIGKKLYSFPSFDGNIESIPKRLFIPIRSRAIPFLDDVERVKDSKQCKDEERRWFLRLNHYLIEPATRDTDERIMFLSLIFNEKRYKIYVDGGEFLLYESAELGISEKFYPPPDLSSKWNNSWGDDKAFKAFRGRCKHKVIHAIIRFFSDEGYCYILNRSKDGTKNIENSMKQKISWLSGHVVIR